MWKRINPRFVLYFLLDIWVGKKREVIELLVLDAVVISWLFTCENLYALNFLCVFADWVLSHVWIKFVWQFVLQLAISSVDSVLYLDLSMTYYFFFVKKKKLSMTHLV
jgi:hypothetical protein